MLVELAAYADGETIAHPLIDAPVIEDFVRYEPAELCIAEFERVLNLQAVTIACADTLRVAIAPLEPVAVGECELAKRHLKRGGKMKPILRKVLAPGRLCPEVSVALSKRQVFARFKGEGHADTFVNGTGHVATYTQRAAQHKINLLVKWHSELHLVPDLPVITDWLGRLRLRSLTHAAGDGQCD